VTAEEMIAPTAKPPTTPPARAPALISLPVLMMVSVGIELDDKVADEAVLGSDREELRLSDINMLGEGSMVTMVVSGLPVHI